MRTSLPSLYLGRSKLRGDLLTLSFLNPESSFYLRELERKLKASPGALARELKALSSEGLLQRQAHGREVFYSLNRAHPLFNELRGIVEKTTGIPRRLSESLGKMREIREAYLYGSVATGEMDAGSDIDLLLVGKETAGVRKLLSDLEGKFSRSINAVTYSPEEFDRKRKDKSEFLYGVLKSPTLRLKP
jgi:predicted nucleotidyltransferase